MTINLASTAPQKFYGLDHLRSLAISYVFLFHYFIISKGQPEWLPDFAQFGWTGVDLFFVLSGFLISSQLFFEIKQGKIISLKEFFIKRFFRIIPAFLVTVGLYFAIPIFREKEALPPLWKFLTFTQNFDLNLKDNGTFSHAWSLCVEEHFYLLLPFVLFFLQKSKLFKWAYWLLGILVLLGFCVRIYCYNALYLPKITDEVSWMYWYKYIYYPTYNRLDGLLIGIAIAAVYCFLPNFWLKISKFGNLLIVLSIFILVGAYFLCTDQQTFNASVFGFPAIALGYGFMVLGAISPTSFLYKWKSKFTTLLASLSYGIYLTHKGIIHLILLAFANYHIDNNLLLILSIFTSFVAAYMLNIIVEKPFLRLRNKLIDTKQI